MSTRYFYQLRSEQFGPISFRELVVLVRDEVVRENDLVRSEWESNWQPAAEIVGLFHLAGRDDVLARWQAEKRREQATRMSTATSYSTDDLDELLTKAAAVSRPARLPASSPPKPTTPTPTTPGDSPPPPEGKAKLSFLSEIIREADEQTLERTACVVPPIQRAWTLSHAFRWGMAVVAANGVALLIIRWSRIERLRFPEATQALQGPCLFPLWGACSYAEFGFLLLDTMLLAGLLGYGLACCLETFAQD